MTIKPVEMWAVARPLRRGGSEICYWIVARKRNDAIEAFIRDWDVCPWINWKHWYRKGHRAIRVLVTPKEALS